MPQKRFEIWLQATMRMVVLRDTQQGRMRAFAVVLLALIDGEWVDIARCDTAHGCPHEDVLGRKAGLLQKIWHDNLSHRQAYDFAIRRYRQDHENIRAQFLAH